MADNAVVNFNTGEGLFAADFNNLSQNILHQIHDFSLYLTSLGLGRNSTATPADYLSVYSTNYATPNPLIGALTFTPDSFSLHVENDTGTNIKIHPGMFWVYDLLTSPNDELTPGFKGFHSSSEVDLSYGTLPAVGNYRYSTIVVEVSSAAATSTSRDFKDAVTGVLTTQSVDKRLEYQATFSLVHGADNVGSALPYPEQGASGTRYPTLSAGQHVVGYVLADNSGVVAVFLATYPVRTGVVSERSMLNRGTPDAEWPSQGINKLLQSNSVGGAGDGFMLSTQAGLSGTRILHARTAYDQNEASLLSLVELAASSAPDTYINTVLTYNVGRNINFATTGDQTYTFRFAPEMFPSITTCLPPIWNTTTTVPRAGLNTELSTVGMQYKIGAPAAGGIEIKNLWLDMIR